MNIIKLWASEWENKDDDDDDNYNNHLSLPKVVIVYAGHWTADDLCTVFIVRHV